MYIYIYEIWEIYFLPENLPLANIMSGRVYRVLLWGAEMTIIRPVVIFEKYIFLNIS